MAISAASFGVQLKRLRETAGFTQEELATIAGLSVHAVSALERGERRRPHLDTVRALSAALDLTGPARDAFVRSARSTADTEVIESAGSQLPRPITGLVGREGDLVRLHELFSDPATRLVTLVGPGGVGKTRLALECAHLLGSHGRARAIFVPLASVRDPARVAPAIAEALGLPDVTAVDLPRRVRAVCVEPTVLVLDNFEHIPDAAPLVAELAASVAALQLLATSRAPLHVRGEREYAVAPLGLSEEGRVHSPADVARMPAVHLLLERIRDVRPDFRLTAGNAETVMAICRRLDALPLALELAARWTKVLPLEDLLDRLRRDILPSVGAGGDWPERQQTMTATVAWSYQLLPPAEQEVLRRLAVLPGVFPIEAAAAVISGRRATQAAVDAALAGVSALIDKSLLQRADTASSTQPLYRMLETVRAYAARELTASGQYDAAMTGLVAFSADEADLAAEGLLGPSQNMWFNRVRENVDTHRAALARLVANGDGARAADVAYGLFYFWLIRGHSIEGLGWYDQILALPSQSTATQIKALLGSGGTSHTHGDADRARAHLTRAIELARGVDDRASVAQAAWMLGHVEYSAGNVDRARQWFTRSRDLFEGLAAPCGLGSSLSGLAWVALADGDYDRATQLADGAAHVLQSSGPWFLSLSLYIRIVVAVLRGNADEAIGLMRRSLMRVKESQDTFAVVYGLVPLAMAAALKGDAAWVARILGARAAIEDRTGSALVDPMMNSLRERTEREAQARLGPVRWTQAFAAGRQYTIDSLLKDIDASLGGMP